MAVTTLGKTFSKDSGVTDLHMRNNRDKLFKFGCLLQAENCSGTYV